MAQQPPQQQGSGDNSMAPVWIMVLLFITLYVMWYAGHRYIVSFIFSINLFQAKLINVFLGKALLAQEIYIMQTVDPAAVTWDQLMLLTRSVGQYSRYPIILFLA